MYIASWHKEIWGVELLKAHLAISADIDPMSFLQKKEPAYALAQLCVTTNTDLPKDGSSITQVLEWKNFDSFNTHSEVHNASIWDPLPLSVDPSFNGHPNIGEVTVRGKNPLEAFQKLLSLCQNLVPLVDTNQGMIESSKQALRRFGALSPQIERFFIRQAEDHDLPSLYSLLTQLTQRAKGEWLTMLPSQTTVFITEDRFASEPTIVGTVSSHKWHNLRPAKDSQTSYIQDLIVHPHYRSIGVGRNLVEEAVRVSHLSGVSKITLACEEELEPFYHTLGFSTVACFMTQYNPEPVFRFDSKQLTSNGDWAYGQKIAKELLVSQLSNISIPQHFFAPVPTKPDDILGAIQSPKKSFSVKYSLRGTDFLGGGIRGGNSSRGRKLDLSLSTPEIREKLRDFIEQAPPHSAGIVLQEFIDQKGGCLFHADITPENTEIDLLWEAYTSTGRAYSKFRHRDTKQIAYEEIQGDNSAEPLERSKACTDIFQKCASIKSKLSSAYGDLPWVIEGFWHPHTYHLQILQLRPTPLDRPLSPLRKTSEAFYSTHFMWGNFETDPFILGSLLSEVRPEIVIRNSSYEETLPPVLIKRLEDKQSTLLCDLSKGFVLSHEKWFLPIPSLRESFNFIHIPLHMIETNAEKTVKILSSERKGYIVPIANKGGDLS